MKSGPPPVGPAGTLSRLIQPLCPSEDSGAFRRVVHVILRYPLSLLPYISLCIFVLCVVEAKLNRREGGVKIITNYFAFCFSLPFGLGEPDLRI